MKWTTANLKSSNYTENHELYVGTNTGSFKKFIPAFEENPFLQRNLHDLKQLTKDDRITVLAFGNDTSEILIGRIQPKVQLHSLRTGQIERTIELKLAPVIGLARFEDNLVVGFGNGQVQHLSLANSDASEYLINSGDDMAHMRQCSYQRNLIATGGKGRQNNLKVFDMAADGKQLFSSKNLPNDYLQLEVPVWDSDVGFIDSAHTLATCSRYGYVRVYDTRTQRRPVRYFATEEQMSFVTLAAHGNYIYTGTTMGNMKALDVRRMKTFVHTYKGFTGALSDVSLDRTGKYLASASLDRYVRVHDVESTVLLYQCYVKSKATRVLIRESLENPNSNSDAAVHEKDVESASTKNENNSAIVAVSEDKEYEDMFDNMQTVCESDADGDSENESQAVDEAQKSGKTTTTTKRKANKNLGKNKKKKQ